MSSKVCWLLLLTYALVVLRHGWMMEDAYISLRTVDNLFHGHGLVWNPGERVQSYTHPLWLMLCIGVRAVTGEYFFSLIMFGAMVSLVAVGLLSLRLARSPTVAIALLMALTLSHAFVDYSTSGLENPLSHLLFALAAWVYLGQLPSARRFAWLCLIGGLALLSRPDNAVVLAPVVLAAGVQAHRRGESLVCLAKAAALGGIPLFAWELFSLIYYGALVPNTALAKLNSGIEAGELIHQGLLYLSSTLDADPLTLAVIFAGMLAPFATRDKRMWPFAIGIALHLAYVVKIGGDFMLGRFLTAPMFMAVICLARVRRVGSIELLVAAAGIAALGLSTSPNTIEIDSSDLPTVEQSRGHRQVTDVRGQLFGSSSLLSARRTTQMPDHRWATEGLRGTKSGRVVEVAGTLGFRGVAGGPDIHWIDIFALSDPLLARLPARWAPDWMTGHFRRQVPKGYMESIERGENLIEDRGVRKLYERVDLVTHGELFSVERFAAIWWLNTGGPARALDEEAWCFAGASRRTPGSLRGEGRVPDGTVLDSKLARRFPATGVLVRYKERQLRRTLEVSLNDADRFEIRFYDGDEEIARVPVDRKLAWDSEGLAARVVDLPEVLGQRGFTRLRILPRTKVHRGRPSYAIGHLLFDDELGA